jgi:hypothetical protein
VIATLVAVVLGTMLAFALVRHQFRAGRQQHPGLRTRWPHPRSSWALQPADDLRAGLLQCRSALGFWTIVIAHIMFCISFVVVTVKARLQSLDPRLEEAARTCTPTPSSTFWRVTFPLVLPGIVGRRCCPSRCPSTTSSSPTSSPATRRPSRSSSTSPTCAASRRRPTSSVSRCSSIALLLVRSSGARSSPSAAGLDPARADPHDRCRRCR